jgi:hypothetical protein
MKEHVQRGNFRRGFGSSFYFNDTVAMMASVERQIFSTARRTTTNRDDSIDYSIQDYLPRLESYSSLVVYDT